MVDVAVSVNAAVAVDDDDGVAVGVGDDVSVFVAVKLRVEVAVHVSVRVGDGGCVGGLVGVGDGSTTSPPIARAMKMRITRATIATITTRLFIESDLSFRSKTSHEPTDTLAFHVLAAKVSDDDNADDGDEVSRRVQHLGGDLRKKPFDIRNQPHDCHTPKNLGLEGKDGKVFDVLHDSLLLVELSVIDELIVDYIDCVTVIKPVGQDVSDPERVRPCGRLIAFPDGIHVAQAPHAGHLMGVFVERSRRTVDLIGVEMSIEDIFAIKTRNGFSGIRGGVTLFIVAVNEIQVPHAFVFALFDPLDAA